PWGVENVSPRERFVAAVRAGVDQFGGTEKADVLVEAVRAGDLTEARLDSSVQRVMEQKLALGLFENPYVDAPAAARTVATSAFRTAGLDAQRRALVLLENEKRLLPLQPNVRGRALRVYLAGVDSAAA